MKQEREYNYLLHFIENLQNQGKYTFSLTQIRKEFKSLSNSALQMGLNRLVKKNKIVSVHKGFYVIVPVEYASRGLLPVISFIDSLMAYLKRPYYVGLLSAAALHGASHQQAQEFFIVTNLPPLRSKLVKGHKINFTQAT